MIIVENFAGFVQPARTVTTAKITSLMTTPYGIGDVVNPSGLIVLDGVSPLQGGTRRLVQIRFVETRSTGAVIGGDFRIHFFRDTYGTFAAQGDAMVYPTDTTLFAGSVLTTSASWSSLGSTLGEYVKSLQGANALDIALKDGYQHLLIGVEARSANTYAGSATLSLEFTWE